MATLGAAFCAGNVLATPPVGLTSRRCTAGRARSGERRPPQGDSARHLERRIKTHGLSDVYSPTTPSRREEPAAGTPSAERDPGRLGHGRRTTSAATDLTPNVYRRDRLHRSGRQVRHMLVGQGRGRRAHDGAADLPEARRDGSTSPSPSPATSTPQAESGTSSAGRAPGPPGARFAEVGLADLVVARKSALAASGQHDLAGLEHVAAVGDAQRHARVLLDEQDRRALRVDVAGRSRRSCSHEDRRQAHRRLVEQQQARAAPSARGRWRASAARRRTACPPSGRRRSLSRGKSAKHALEVLGDRLPGRRAVKAPSSRFSTTVIRGKMPAALRRLGDAQPDDRRAAAAPSMSLALEA